MKVPLSWIREFVDVKASAEEIGTLMGVRGLPLEGLTPHGDDLVMDFEVHANRPDLLSMIGVYGLTASDVSARRRELAIRLALGASSREALWTVIRPCAAVLGVGTALGVVGAVGAGRGLASLLHGVGPADVPTLTVAPILLSGSGILAAVAAARRVLQTEPAATLRSE